MIRHASASLTVALALACAGAGSQIPLALTPVPQEPATSTFTPKGEVLVRQGGAGFDDWRVTGPRVNLTRGADGTWSGSLLGANVALKPSPGKLYGSGAELNFVRWGEFVMIQGTLGGRQMKFRVQPGPGFPVKGGILCAATPRSVDCTPRAANANSELELRGEAARIDAPMPQFGLALIAALL